MEMINTQNKVLADSKVIPLSIKDLTIGYGERVVAGDISLDVHAGELLALVGSNGSGKSTLLKTICGELAPLGGTIQISGRALRQWSRPELARYLAVMLTARPATELLTCRDIVETGRLPFTGRLGILSEDDHAQVDEAMAIAHVSELAENDFMHISDGQRQRVLLARAIAQEPKLLVLDEPTAYLDMKYQLDLLKILRRLAKSRGVAIVASLHEVELALKAADSVMCIKDGDVFLHGAPEEVLTTSNVSSLYGLEDGSFNATFGNVELGRPEGQPHTFVIAGGGTGATIFRRLAREGVPFFTGVLHQGDVDAVLAADLAACCVVERAFEPISEASLAQARELLAQCDTLVCCVSDFATLNSANAKLLDFASESGITIQMALGNQAKLPFDRYAATSRP